MIVQSHKQSGFQPALVPVRACTRFLRGIRNLIRRRMQLRRLLLHPNPQVSGLARALNRARWGAPGEKESLAISTIEQLRTTLLKDQEEIQTTDYGAGSPNANLTPSQMAQGQSYNRTVAEICRLTSKSPRWCRLLFELAREIRPAVVIEMGTSMGISSSYLAAALELNNSGQLITLEGSPPVAERARRHFDGLGLNRARIIVGRFCDTLADVLGANAPIEYVFVDGHHEEHATMRYYEQIKPFLADSALLVFDDISWSNGMRRAWRHIQADPNVAASCHLGELGVIIQCKTPIQHPLSCQFAF